MISEWSLKSSDYSCGWGSVNVVLWRPLLLTSTTLRLLQVRKDCSVFSFCTVSGVLVRVGTAMTELMAAALRNGVRTLLLADDDEEDVREAARACGLEVRPAALVADLLNPDIFEASD